MSASYLLKQNAKCLVAVADEERHAFLVATANLRGPNEIRLLRYYEEEDEIECAAVYNHDHEVAGMSACPYDKSLVLTVANVDGDSRAVVWRMPDLPGDTAGARHSANADSTTGAPKDLERIAAFPAPAAGSRVLFAQWCPAAAPSADGSGSILTVDDTALRLWALRNDGSAAVSATKELPTGDVMFVGGAAWDGLHPNEVAVACDASVHVWDVRAADRVRTIERAVPAGSCVRTVSYNGNKPWHLATGGDDHRVKIWDLRKPTSPVKILDGHTHWVTSVAFNAFHDQLMISGGSDGRVNLWRVSSVSSAPLLELGDDEIFAAEVAAGGARKSEPKLAADVAIRSHEEHDDSVYAAVWSAHTAWVYASLSYTGKVVFCQVPCAEKYKILL